MAPFQSVPGYCERRLPSVILSIFFKASPMAMNCIQIPSSFSMPDGESVKSFTVWICSERLFIFPRASSICRSMDNTRFLSNIHPLFFYAFFKERIHFFPHPNNIHVSMYQFFNLFLDMYQRKRVWSPCFYTDVNIAIFTIFTPCNRTEYPDLNYAVFICKVLFEIMQNSKDIILFHYLSP